MALLIDTYNVVHVVGVLPPELAGADIAGLAALIRISRYRQQHVTFVCDGLKSDSDLGEFQSTDQFSVRFSGSGHTADDLIARLIEQSSTPRRLIIISSDRAVQRAGKRRKCKVFSSETFLRQLASDAKARNVTLVALKAPPAEKAAKKSQQTSGHIGGVEKWIKLFGIDEEAVAREAAKILEPEPPAAKPTKPAAEQRIEQAEKKKPPRIDPPNPSGTAPPGRVRRSRGGIVRLLPESLDPGPAMPESVLPDTLIAQAEMLLRQTPEDVAQPRTGMGSKGRSRRSNRRTGG
jgi:predicted RNA-binding protein with PIN domain